MEPFLKYIRLESVYGADNDAEPVVKSKLARAYANMGRFEESERSWEGVIRLHSRKSADQYLLAAALHDVSALMLDKGDWARAKEKAGEAVEQCESLYGPFQPSTWKAKETLARALYQLDQKAHAVKFRAEIVDAADSRSWTRSSRND